MVGMPGIEPGLHEPESRVLPVYYIPFLCLHSSGAGIVADLHILIQRSLGWLLFFLRSFIYTTGMELNIYFDRDIATEPRFNLRRWFENFVEAINIGNLEYWQNSLSDSLSVVDLTEEELTKQTLITYLLHPTKRVEFYELEVEVEDGVYRMKGELETFQEGFMVFEGQFEMHITQTASNTFLILGLTCYPRIRVTVK